MIHYLRLFIALLKYPFRKRGPEYIWGNHISEYINDPPSTLMDKDGLIDGRTPEELSRYLERRYCHACEVFTHGTKCKVCGFPIKDKTWDKDDDEEDVDHSHSEIRR